jgi:hypothetical protein
MIAERIRSDFVVVGGGLSGVCAAIAAARRGIAVTLIHDRPVLGGNSSSEIRLWALGASHARRYTRFARESGIMGELFLENLYRNPEGNPILWDTVLYEWTIREPNLTLLLDTPALSIEQSSDGSITSVRAFCPNNETEYVVYGTQFMDATGDGLIGFQAGAEFRIGREGRDEFDESMAPEHPDRWTLGNTIYFHTKDVGKPVRFIKPSYALDITKTDILKYRRLDESVVGCNLWWVEYGGVLDTIHDNRYIKHHLWQLAYGIWDYIKNSGKFDVENLTLEWIGQIPGKRESRRFIGDYILTENDCMDQADFHDGVAIGGWSLDLHPSEGIYSPEPPCWQVYPPGVFDIPYRTLYSKSVPNLFVGGRMISASHVAFGATRVMATCAVMGQAQGTAAALCIRDGISPGKCGDGKHLRELRRQLLRDDQHILRARNEDPDDLARSATINASSSAQLTRSREVDAGIKPLDHVKGVMIPVVNQLDSISLLMDISAQTTLKWSLHTNDRLFNYLPNVEEKTGTLDVEPGEKQWITFPSDIKVDTPRNVWILLQPDEAVVLHSTTDPIAGVLSVWQEPEDDQGHFWPVLDDNLQFRVDPSQPCWDAANVIDGWNRPNILPHIWVSEPISKHQEWLALSWLKARALNEVRLALNSNLDRLIYTVQRDYDFRVIPQLVKTLHVEAKKPDGTWVEVAGVKDNHHRVVSLDLGGVVTDSLRIVFDETQGHDRIEVFEVRVY